MQDLCSRRWTPQLIMMQRVTRRPPIPAGRGVARLTYNSARLVRQRRCMGAADRAEGDVLGGPAAHAGVLATQGALDYSKRGAPYQLSGGRGGGRIFERDEADSQPRTGCTERRVEAVQQALAEPGASRPAGPGCHHAEPRGADPPYGIRETGPAAHSLGHAITDSPVVAQFIAIDVHDGDADRPAVADRRRQELLGATEQAAVVPQPAAIVQQSFLARPIRFRLRAELGSEAEAKLLRIHRLAPQLVRTRAQGLDALRPGRV